MSQGNQALKVAMAAAEQLPPKLRRTLAERLLAQDFAEERMVVVRLQRLSPGGQERLAELLDKNSEGRLTRAERREMKELGEEADQVMLRNSKALAQALRPDLFDSKGRPIRARCEKQQSDKDRLLTAR